MGLLVGLDDLVRLIHRIDVGEAAESPAPPGRRADRFYRSPPDEDAAGAVCALQGGKLADHRSPREQANRNGDRNADEQGASQLATGPEALAHHEEDQRHDADDGCGKPGARSVRKIGRQPTHLSSVWREASMARLGTAAWARPRISAAWS